VLINTLYPPGSTMSYRNVRQIISGALRIELYEHTRRPRSTARCNFRGSLAGVRLKRHPQFVPIRWRRTKDHIENTIRPRKQGPYLCSYVHTGCRTPWLEMKSREHDSAYGQLIIPVIMLLQLRGQRLCRVKLTNWTVSFMVDYVLEHAGNVA